MIFSLFQDWSVSLAEEAQEAAEKCEVVRERGVNVFYNTSLLSLDAVEVAIQVVEPWRDTTAQQVCCYSYSIYKLANLKK